MWWVESGCTAAASWGTASRTSSVLLAAFVCSCRQVFFSIRLVSVHEVHPYSSIDTAAGWKKLRFILSVRSDFHMTDSLSVAVHPFASHWQMQPPKPKPCYIIWNEPLQALASMSIHTRRNICALIKHATSPH